MFEKFKLLPILGIDEKLEDHIFNKSKVVVRTFYYFVAVFSVFFMMKLTGMSAEKLFDPSWQISWWASSLSFQEVIYVLQFGGVVLSLISAFFYKRVWARVLMFFTYFQFFGFQNSFEEIQHSWYQLFYALFFLMFLPDVWKVANKARKKTFLLFVWASQAFVLMSYSMSALEKILRSIKEIYLGNTSILNPESMSMTVAYYGAKHERTGAFSSFFIEYSWISWFIFLFSIYALLFAVVVAFRPNLHKIWGVILLGFHLGTYFALKIIFIPTIGLLLFLFWQSPFTPDEVHWKDVLMDLPVFGDIWQFSKKKFS